MKKIIGIAVALVLLGTSAANATLFPTFLAGSNTSDDAFALYLSIDDSVLGTQISSGNDWHNTFSFGGIELTHGLTYYLHAIAANDGGPEMYIGSFSMNNAAFHFGNGTQALGTDVTNWRASPAAAAWTAPSGTPISFGAQNDDPWGSISFIENGSLFIWSDPSGLNDQAFFSTTITPAPPRVPEPASFSLLALGLLAFGAIRRRKVSA